MPPMIADTFHLDTFESAADLNLTEEQRDALHKTLILLESGKVIHMKEEKIDELDTADEEVERAELLHIFNMLIWGGDDATPTILTSGNCGTACCIGGTAEFLVGKPIFNGNHFEDHSLPIWQLFNPPASQLSDHDWDKITPEMAAKVLRHYLTTGETRWDLVATELPKEASDDGDL